jgi:hypothetical protein
VWSSKAFDIAKEVEDMEVDGDDKVIDTAQVVTPAKSVNWTVVGNKQKEKEQEKDNNEIG